MTAATPALMVFYADVLVVALAAWVIACASNHQRQGFLEAGLAWSWACVGVVAGTGTILGLTGGFNAFGFFIFHLAFLLILATWRHRERRADFQSLTTALRAGAEFFKTPGIEKWIGLGLVIATATLTAIAAAAEPAIMDSITYHLPRLGHWLQNGRVEMFETNDERMNFVAAIPEVVMAWLVGGVSTGFKLSVIAQAFGGIMTVGATVGLARLSGLSKIAALIAAILLLGMANVVAQFTSAQTDLFTAGVFSVSFYLWLVALRRGKVSALGAMGAGLALGAKGTLFYLAPGALVWLIYLILQNRPTWSYWRKTILFGLVGCALFALPGFIRNAQHYGDILGPKEWVKKHHQKMDSVSGLGQKVRWNLTSALAQNLEPQSQPHLFRAPAKLAADALWRQLPVEDNYSLPGIDRRTSLREVLDLEAPDADVGSFGIVTLALFVMGLSFALFRHRPGSKLIRVWGVGVIIFLLFFHTMQGWHPYGFRYFVIAAPWIAIVGAWGIEQISPGWRPLLRSFVLLVAFDICSSVTIGISQGGLSSVLHPERFQGSYVTQGWREWSQRLDHADEPISIRLTEELPVAAFYRQHPARKVTHQKPLGANVDVTAEDMVRHEPGWIIVPVSRFLGREGRVASCVWLYRGQEDHVYSLAAFRALAPHEEPSPIVYRNRQTYTATEVIFELLFKTVDEPEARLTLKNLADQPLDYTWDSPEGTGSGLLPLKETREIIIPMPSHLVGEIRVVFEYSGIEAPIVTVSGPTDEFGHESP